MQTAEICFPGHPDKVCDRIADAIAGGILSLDPKARTAIEVMGGHGKIFITGEVRSTQAGVVTALAREATESMIKDFIPKLGENLFINVVEQSPEIGRGVDAGGAGDNGIVTGMARKNWVTSIISDQKIVAATTIPMVHSIAKALADYLINGLGLDDGKLLLSMDDNCDRVLAVVVNARGAKAEALIEHTQDYFALVKIDTTRTEFFANTAGDWDIGGFDADTGLTGRKIVQDNYGSALGLGGGAFSGKDFTKVDRSGACRCRELANSILAGTEGAREVRVQAVYAIGRVEPIDVSIEMDYSNPAEGLLHARKSIVANGGLSSEWLQKFTVEEMLKDYRSVWGNRDNLEKLAAWGHFNNPMLQAPWETVQTPVDFFDL